MSAKAKGMNFVLMIMIMIMIHDYNYDHDYTKHVIVLIPKLTELPPSGLSAVLPEMKCYEHEVNLVEENLICMTEKFYVKDGRSTCLR